jgi:hypothetical protein
MLGQFLELSIPSVNLAESFDFYVRLGFTELLDTGAADERSVALGDGRLALRLCANDPGEPRIVFVRPDVAGTLANLNALGCAIGHSATETHRFNWIEGRLPGGVGIRLLEARTHSPIHYQPSLLGWFDEIGLPLSLGRARPAEWEALGFAVIDETDNGDPIRTFVSDSICFSCGVHTARTRLALLYSCADMGALREALERRRIPVEGGESAHPGNGASLHLVAPEGTPIIVRSIR